MFCGPQFILASENLMWLCPSKNVRGTPGDRDRRRGFVYCPQVPEFKFFVPRPPSPPPAMFWDKIKLVGVAMSGKSCPLENLNLKESFQGGMAQKEKEIGWGGGNRGLTMEVKWRCCSLWFEIRRRKEFLLFLANSSAHVLFSPAPPRLFWLGGKALGKGER